MLTKRFGILYNLIIALQIRKKIADVMFFLLHKAE